MKKIIEKTETKTRNVSQRIVIREYLDILSKKKTGKQFYGCFINIRPNLAYSVQSYKSISYENFLKYE